MPANASVEFILAQKKYEKARTLEEKLQALLEMQKYAPQHKGAENLRKEISRRIRQIREKLEKQREAKKASGRSIGVKKEGIAQIALLGMPNSGKSTLLHALTGVDVEIANYEFTTKEPKVGMMEYRKAKIQLVELPGIIEGSSFGKARGTEWLSIARTADAIALVCDASMLEYQLQILLNELRNSNIIINRKRPKIEVKKSEFHGIEIAGEKFLKVPKKEVERFLKERGYYNLSVLFLEPSGLEELEMVLNKSLVYINSIIIAVDKYGNASVPEKFQGIKCVRVSKLHADEVKNLKEELFKILDLILIHTKKPSGEIAEQPLALPRGATVSDVAKRLHKEIYEKLKCAKVWGSTKIPGQKVSKDYELRDNDIVELIF